MDETEHCMHLEENVDLWYLSEIFFSLRYMSVPSDANRYGILVCPRSGPAKRRRSSGSKLSANFVLIAGG